MQLKNADATMTLKYPTLSPIWPGIIRPKSDAPLPWVSPTEDDGNW